MISFESLLEAFHQAAMAACDGLASKNQDIVGQYFEESKSSDNLEIKLQKAKEATDKLKDNSEPDPVSLEKAANAVLDVANAIKGEGFSTSQNTCLKPKMVTLQFPKETKGGHSVHDVHVPLISLVPVSLTSIDEVKVVTELEFALENNELMVSFPQKNHHKEETGEQRRDQRCISKIELKMTPSKETEGLRKIIEGYDKILRAQIPG
ncbi:DUF2589 domain-containing protein [Xanthovirga aplysinae]|uniref:DUF2589 domain-containing protein n=1 Tax=Xanthovirga aplysinae TaxID=2529853 RepID=UPI0012BB52BE|nr:DUF2589 domain-containing protein [Xanthovirga aplysinae]MTI31080.1 DUF2589 domain-containing protein [Xanthovirga aplysinae]